MKVATILGTRPEIIRLSRVIAKLDVHVRHVVVHTGQNYDYELNQVFFDDLGVRKPDYFLEAAGASPCETVGLVIARVDAVLERERPDACLILGDTNSSLAAYAAKRRKIPIFHMEAGNRCFDMRVPEEINRRVVDHLADVNLTYSAIAREYLLREGMAPDRVIWTGSPMLEVLAHYRDRIAASTVLERLEVERGQYHVASLHREENVDVPANLKKVMHILEAVSVRTGKPIILSTHPRTQKRLQDSGLNPGPGIRAIKPLGFTDYVRLQQQAALVLSDSGTITEESSILGFPAINLREAHERPEGMEEAAVILAGIEEENVLGAVAVLLRDAEAGRDRMRMVRDYDVPNVSDKVVRLILSYTPFVNRVVWQKRA